MTPTWPPRVGLAARLRHAVGRSLLRARGAEAMRGLAQLRQRLGQPGTILCLGNGPSSESAELPTDFDCLFRVNWIWRQRAFLIEPDLVFTADPDLPPPGSRAILGFPTAADADRILRAHLRQDRAPAAWFTVPDLLPELAARRWPAYPTNGALMVAVAAALRPQRLVIAGIDLYRDPQGKYPGANDEPNEYGGLHNRDTDLDYMRMALSAYDGALVILSAALRDSLETA